MEQLLNGIVMEITSLAGVLGEYKRESLSEVRWFPSSFPFPFFLHIQSFFLQKHSYQVYLFREQSFSLTVLLPLLAFKTQYTLHYPTTK
jgi:hypothetical protein